MPILAKKAIRRTAGIKHGQVVATGMAPTFADPIGNTVGRKWIAIPMQHALSRSAGQVDQATILYSPQTAKSEFTFSDLAFVAAQFTGHAFRLMRGFAGKTKFLAGALVTGFNVWLGVSEITEQAIPTNANGC